MYKDMLRYSTNTPVIHVHVHVHIHIIMYGNYTSDAPIRDFTIYRYTDNYFKYTCISITDTDPILYLHVPSKVKVTVIVIVIVIGN